MSEVAVPTMSQRDAERLTERIRITAHNYAEARMNLYQLVQDAKEGKAHEALGYKSWTAYLADVLGEEPMRLARGERQEMVRMLSDEGMSTRAIAPIVGVSNKTVSVDLSSSEVLPEVTPAPRETTGRDGKTYTQPAPVQFDADPATVNHDTGEIEPEPKTKRRPLPEQYRDAVVELTRATERLARLSSDDRFPARRADLAAIYGSDLNRALSSITETTHSLTQEN